MSLSTELLEVTNFRSSLESAITEVVSIATEELPDLGLYSESVQSEVREAVAKISGEIAQEFDARMSTEDLQSVIDFYRSPVARRYLQVSSTLDAVIQQAANVAADQLVQKLYTLYNMAVATKKGPVS